MNSHNMAGGTEINFAMDLPIHAHLELIGKVLQQHQVIVISGQTGSGKTTQIPKLCLARGRGLRGLIGHTQPRRIAAKSVALRIAEELGVVPGQLVGYQIRHSDHTTAMTRIKLMTDGILLAELQHDRNLQRYDTIIIDEAHERSLNIDFILGYLKRLLPRRPDLKLIIASATIDTERFSRHFDNAPVIEVSGRSYPVEVRYSPPESGLDKATGQTDAEEDETFLAIQAAIRELSRHGPGDILIFLEGEREIHDLARYLKRQQLPDTDILPLYSRLSSTQQALIFKPHKRRHIVLATNVAETSLTIPGIHFVIDTGYARINRYNRRSKVQQLPVEKISQAAAEQRQGRCGRTAPGICIRLYDEQDFQARPAFTEPEILRTNLAAVILQMKTLQLGDIHDFPFMDAPDMRYINDGLRLLTELGAIDTDENLTRTGRRIARLPLDPGLARALLAAGEQGCVREMLVIVSALSIQDPRERPLDMQQQADEAHAKFRNERSDFQTLLNLWEFYYQHARTLGFGRLRKLCRQNFLSHTRMREWREVHDQLCELAAGLDLNINSGPAAYENIHTALITGLLSHVAVKTDEREYTGARDIKLNIFPGSGLFRKSPKWIVSAELVETTKLYARTVAGIEAQWILRPAAHLLQREYFEPWWDGGTGHVFVFERIKLFGLTLIEKQKINYGRVNPADARQIFIRKALVDREYRSQGTALEYNNKIVKDLLLLECKARRHDIFNENALYDFYNRQVPQEICNGPAFEKWLALDPGANGQLQLQNREEIMYHDAESITATKFPDVMHVAGKTLPLTYCFAPGEPDDGITVHVPLPILNQINPSCHDYLVPGMLEEKIILMLKGLPKQVRRSLAPLQEAAQECMQKISMGSGSLAASMADYLARSRGIRIDGAVWTDMELPDYLQMNIKVLDNAGNVMGQGRDLRKLQRDLSSQIQDCFNTVQAGALPRTGIKKWDFGDLPEYMAITVNATPVTAYPALVDMQQSVSLQIFSTREEAAVSMQAGLKRLFMLELRKEFNDLKKNLPHLKEMILYYSPVGTHEELVQDLLELIAERVFLHDRPDLRSHRTYTQRKDVGIKILYQQAGNICRLAYAILSRYHALKRRLDALPPGHAAPEKDIHEHLKFLVRKKFIILTDMMLLEEYPRYLDAIARRLDKLSYAPQKDERQYAKIKSFYEAGRAIPDPGVATGELRKHILEYHRMLEEYRVSLFAQELGTKVKVSELRLQQQLESVRNACVSV